LSQEEILAGYERSKLDKESSASILNWIH
jgi:hypothetical protein